MTQSTNGHRLVLFDIDGTLLSAGRAARESVLAALERIFGWKGQGAADGYDFSGKTDPQILRELVGATVGEEHLARELPRALDLYLEELERRLDPSAVKVKPGIPPLVDRLASDSRVTLGLLTGNIERGARLKLEPPGLNRYFPFGAFGSDSADRYSLPAVAIERARQSTGRAFAGKSVVIVGDSVHDVACGRSLGARAVAVATGWTSRERLLAEKPDAFFADFSDVDSAFEAILS
ncbi:MAG TPA: HAD family hydrolase [Thermoanaerobaculia bacterium]|jgi:phosphoglycolate phosphatase-like HAD superfamily hydrolase